MSHQSVFKDKDLFFSGCKHVHELFLSSCYGSGAAGGAGGAGGGCGLVHLKLTVLHCPVTHCFVTLLNLSLFSVNLIKLNCLYVHVRIKVSASLLLCLDSKTSSSWRIFLACLEVEMKKRILGRPLCPSLLFH